MPQKTFKNLFSTSEGKFPITDEKDGKKFEEGMEKIASKGSFDLLEAFVFLGVIQ